LEKKKTKKNMQKKKKPVTVKILRVLEFFIYIYIFFFVCGKAGALHRKRNTAGNKKNLTAAKDRETKDEKNVLLLEPKILQRHVGSCNCIAVV
jgi:uracil phosphoribosyltransferase